MASFADDTRVLIGASSTDDVKKLQADLNLIYQWAEQNNATFNTAKFKCLRYGLNQDLKNGTSYVSASGSPINSEAIVRDLEVIMSDDALFSDHITNVVWQLV